MGYGDAGADLAQTLRRGTAQHSTAQHSTSNKINTRAHTGCSDQRRGTAKQQNDCSDKRAPRHSTAEQVNSLAYTNDEQMIAQHTLMMNK